VKASLKIIITLCVFFSASTVWAQEDDKPNYYTRPDYKKTEEPKPEKTETETEKPKPVQPYKYNKKKFDWKNILIEPNIQLFFTGDFVQFGLMPSVAYKVWKKGLFVGGALNYNIISQPRYPLSNGATKSISTQVFGGGPVVHYSIWKGFFARVRPELLGIRYPESYQFTGPASVKINYKTQHFPYLWLGAGYNFTHGRNLFVPVAFYFDPVYFARTQSTYNPYQQAFYIQLAFYIISPRIR
jgi:hypothetical protein